MSLESNAKADATSIIEKNTSNEVGGQSEQSSSVENKDNNTSSSSSQSAVLDNSKRKVIVYNVDKFLKPNPLKKLIHKWTSGTDIKVEKTKKPPKNNWVVLTLESESMVEEFMKILNDGTHKNKRGGTMEAKRPVEAFENDGKRSRDGRDGRDSGNKRARRDQAPCVKTADEVRDMITPLWRMSYEEQMETKSKLVVNKCFAKISTEIKKKFQTLAWEYRKNNGSKDHGVPKLYGWLRERKTINMSPLMGAPKQEKYRNKCELTFGHRHSYEEPSQTSVEEVKEADTENKEDVEMSTVETPARKIIKTPAVGFMAGGWSGGVSNPHDLSNIPDIVCGIADVINEFLKTSPVPPYAPKEHRGIWRTVTIRSSERTNQCMIIIVHAPSTGGAGKRDDGSDDYSAVFEGEKERLIKMLTAGKIPKPARNLAGDESSNTDGTDIDQFCDIPITSIFFQEFEGLSNPPPQHPVQHVYGKECIEEKLLQCTFQISPGAFFQVTTEGAENLYGVVVDKLKEVTTNPKDTLLFDVCCGTGTIGLTCMKEGAVGKVVGIDISEPAIKDAIINAEKNGYAGADDVARFVASRAELVMSDVVRKADRNCPMVAVVDPAREGLHQDVIKALRNQPELQRIVYVSCNPTGSLVKDAGLLCTPQTKKYRGLPFKITAAQPVDMFPLTNHCEMVMVFDRMTEEECGQKDASQTVKSTSVEPKAETKETEEEKPKEESA